MKRTTSQKLLFMTLLSLLGVLSEGRKASCTRTYTCPSMSMIKKAHSEGLTTLKIENGLFFFKAPIKESFSFPVKERIGIYIQEKNFHTPYPKAYLSCLYAFGNHKEQWDLLLLEGDRAKTCKIYQRKSRNPIPEGLSVEPNQADAYYVECSE